MRTIIAGTDFTPSSLNACAYAAMLAKKLGCKLTLFNLYEVPVIHSNSGLYFISYQAIRDNSEEKMTRLLREIRSKFPKVKTEVLLTTGSFKKEMEDFVAHHEVEAVVIGLATKSKLSKFIYGSHSTDIAGRIHAPVIIVPEQYKTHGLRTILLGVDNQKKLEKSSLTSFMNFIADSKARLKVLHVRTQDELFAPSGTEFKMPGKTYKVESFFAKDLQDGMNKFARKNNSDMIAIISKQHSPLYDFFAESNTKKIAFVSKVPVMAIHE